VRGVVLLAAAAVAMAAAAACGDSALQTTGAHVPALAGKPASFDDLEIDQSRHTIYAADRTDSGIDVFDVSGASPKFVRTVKLPAPPNGLALAPQLGRLYAGTGSGAIEVVDTLKASVVSEVRTGAAEVDLLDFAPGPGLLFAATGVDGKLLTIDAATGKIVATAKVGKPLEQPRYDSANGLVYVSVPELDALAAVDPHTGTVEKVLKLGGCLPRGLAIRPSSNTAVIACRKSVVAYDLRTGAQNAFGRVAFGDVVHYYPEVDRFFVTAPQDQVPTVVAAFGGDPVGYVGSVDVNGGGNAAVYDAARDTVYTTDPRPASGGITGFRIDGTRPVPLLQSAVLTVGPFLALVLLVAPLWYFLGRRADPVNRRARPAVPAPAVVVLARPKNEGS
jgi:hypothetical protein